MYGFFVRRDEKSGHCREVAVSGASTVGKKAKKKSGNHGLAREREKAALIRSLPCSLFPSSSPRDF